MENNDPDLDDCRNCGPSDYEALGMIPQTTITGQEINEDTWVKAFMCTSCGDVQIKSITEEELEDALDEIISMYERYELVPQEQIDEMKR